MILFIQGELSRSINVGNGILWVLGTLRFAQPTKLVLYLIDSHRFRKNNVIFASAGMTKKINHYAVMGSRHSRKTLPVIPAKTGIH